MNKKPKFLLGGVVALAATSAFWIHQLTENQQNRRSHSLSGDFKKNEKSLSDRVEAASISQVVSVSQLGEHERSADAVTAEVIDASVALADSISKNYTQLSPQNQRVVEAIQRGAAIEMKVGGVSRQLMLTPRQVFGEEAKIRRPDGSILLDPSQSVRVFAGEAVPLTAASSAESFTQEVENESSGVASEQNSKAQSISLSNSEATVPLSGMSANELLEQFPATRSGMTMIGSQYVLKLLNNEGDQVLVRNNPKTGETELRYEPLAMQQEDFGECLSGECEHDHSKPVVYDPLALEELGREVSPASNPDKYDTWMSVGAGIEFQAIEFDPGGNPATGNNDYSANPLPYGPKYHESLTQLQYFLESGPDLLADADNPTDQDISSMLCRLLLNASEVNEIYERNAGFEMHIAELVVRTNDNTGQLDRGTLFWSHRGGTEGLVAQGTIYGWGGGGAAAGVNFNISAWVVGWTHEIGHILGLGHTLGNGLMGPAGGPPHFWGTWGNSTVTSADTLYHKTNYRQHARRGLVDSDEVLDGFADGGAQGDRVTRGSKMRNPREFAYANGDAVSTALNAPIEFDPLANDDRSTPYSEYYNADLVIEEIGRVVPANSATVEIIDNGKRLRVTPAMGFEGNVGFQYTLRGSVGNNGRGWLHRAPVNVTVGGGVDPYNITLIPGEDRAITFPANIDSIDYPTMADIFTSGSWMTFRAHPDATGSEVLNASIGGNPQTVTITYSGVGRSAVDDLVSADGSEAIRFNPLANDQVGGVLQLDNNISRFGLATPNTTTDKIYDFAREYKLQSAVLNTPTMGTLELEQNFRIFPDGSTGVAPTGFLVFRPAAGASGFAEIAYSAVDVDGSVFNGTARVLVGLAEVTSPARDYTVLRQDMGLVLETNQIPATGAAFTGTSTLQWSVVNQPSGGNVTIDDITSASTVARFSEPGRYRLRLEATDNGNTKTLERWVMVEAADAPYTATGERAPWVNASATELTNWNQGSWNTSALAVDAQDDSFSHLIDLAPLATASWTQGDGGFDANGIIRNYASSPFGHSGPDAANEIIWEMDLGSDKDLAWVDIRINHERSPAGHTVEILNDAGVVIKTQALLTANIYERRVRIPLSDTGERIAARRVRITKAVGPNQFTVVGVNAIGIDGGIADLTVGAEASQSTTHFNSSDYAARYALDEVSLDGSRNGARTDSSTVDNWWEIDFGQERELSRIWFRLNADATNHTVTAFDNGGAQTWQTTLDANTLQYLNAIPASTMARRVRIAVPSGVTQQLWVHEFDAYGIIAGGNLTTTWSEPSGLGAAFADISQEHTSVTLSSNGNYTLRLTADDGWNKTVKDFAVNYDGTSTAPTGNGIDDAEVSTGGVAHAVDLFEAFGDMETVDGSLAFSVVSVSNASLFTSDPTGAITDPVNFALNTAMGVAGSSDVVIRATDLDGNSTDVTFTIVAANQPPVAPRILEITISELLSVGQEMFDLKDHITDPDGDALTFTYPDNYNTGYYSTNANGVFTLTGDLPLLNANGGISAFQVRVSDGVNEPTITQLQVSILDENRPVDVAGATVDVETTAILNHPFYTHTLGTQNDPGETYTWQILSGNTDGDFAIDSATGAISPLNTLDVARTASYTLEVQVTDDSSPAEMASVNIVLNVSDDVMGDSDMDDLSDWWETTYIGNLASGPYDDPDGDLWWNERELVKGTHPNLVDVPDSDSDGWNDAIEEVLGTYPDSNTSKPILISADIQADTRNLTYTGVLPASGLGDQWNALEGPMFTNGTQVDPSWSNLNTSDGSATSVDFGFTGTTTFYEGFGTLSGDKALYDDYLILGVVGADASVSYQFSDLEVSRPYLLTFYGTTDTSRGTDITIGSQSMANIGITGFKSFATSSASGTLTGTITTSNTEGNVSGFELIGADPSNANPAPVITSAIGSTLMQYTAPGATAGTVTATGEGGETLVYSIPFGNDAGLFAINQSGVITLVGALDDQAVGQHTLTIYVRDSYNHPAITTVVIDVVASSQLAAMTNGSPILGVIDGANLTVAGTSRANAGSVDLMVDGNSSAAVNTFWPGNSNTYSYAGMLWSEELTEYVSVIELDMALYTDGGWFGVSGQSPAEGAALEATTHIGKAVAPILQVTQDGGVSWTTVNAATNYVSRFTGATIGGGANPNPVSQKLLFVLETPTRNIDGFRIVGENGGLAGSDDNGFIGVFELDAFESVDPNAPVLASTSANVDEGVASGATVIDLNATDANGDMLSYSILSGNDAGLFAIDNDGIVTTPSGLGMQYAGNTYTLTIEVSDGALTDIASLVITVTNDLDGDGFVNSLEVELGTDPNDSGSTPASHYAGLVGWWKLNENTGTLAADSSGNGHNGTVNGAVWDTGVDGSSLDFDGSSHHVNLGNPSHMNIVGEITMSAWVKADATNGLNNILAHGLTRSPDAEVQMRINSGVYEVGSWNGTGAGISVGDATADLNSWVHIAGVYDGTHWRLYRNGMELANVASAQGALSVNADWAIGATGSGSARNFDGTIDEVRLFNRGLTPAEILAIYNEHASAPPAVSNSTFSVVENGGAGLLVGSVGATDPEGDTLAYQITTGNGSGLFAIDANGQITTTADLDFELASQHILTVQVSDVLNTVSATITVNVNEDPYNITNAGSAIIGIHDGVDLTLLGTAFANAGTAADAIDGDLSNTVDTFNSNGQSTHSYIGLTWATPRTDNVEAIEIHFATFRDGGWFGVNNIDPDPGEPLLDPDHISAATVPIVQVTTDGGTTWTTVANTNNYLAQMTGHTIGGGANPNPSLAPIVRFQLDTPMTGIDGIRVIGTEGGAASRGFIGIAELNVFAESPLTVIIPALTVSASDAEAEEFDVANTGEFTITADQGPGSDITINYTLSGAATNGVDYTNLTGSVTLVGGNTSVNIPVTAITDALVEGDEVITLTLSVSADYTIATASADVTIKDLPFDDFRETYFAGQTVNVSDLEDFDGDGIVNFLEYALGLDPTQNSAEPMTMEYLPATNELQLSYEEDTTLADVNYIVETSPTLPAVTWETAGISVDRTAPIVNGKQPVKAKVTVTAGSKFLRVRAVRVTTP